MADEASCTWVTGQSTPRPRSCADCLNTPMGELECAINTWGACVAMEPAMTAQDFRRGLKAFPSSSSSSSSSSISSASASSPDNALSNIYPAANTTYCASSDTTCQRCRQEIALTDARHAAFVGVDSHGNNVTTDATWSGSTAFCFGNDGCICAAICETVDWETRVRTSLHTDRPASTATSLGGDASSSSSSSSSSWSPHASSSSDTPPLKQGYMILLVLAVAGLVLLFWIVRKVLWSWTRCGRGLDDVAVTREQQSQRSASLRLDLPGWHALQQQLISTDAQAPGEQANAKKEARSE